MNFTRNYGKSAALDAVFKRAEGEVVITMDADLQDSPDEIPGLFQMVSEGLDSLMFDIAFILPLSTTKYKT